MSNLTHFQDLLNQSTILQLLTRVSKSLVSFWSSLFPDSLVFTVNSYVLEGDTLYIESISRLGRSTKDLLNIIDTLTDKGITLISHKENIDTNTPSGKFMLTVFAALSQLEREQLKQRQREGIEIAKAQGKYTGRKPIPTDWTRFGQLYGEWKSKSITERDFMRRMDMSANTFYRRVREYEIRYGITEQTSA